MSNTPENWSTYRSFPNPLNDFTFIHDDPSRSSTQLNIDHKKSSADPNHDPNGSFVDPTRSPADEAGIDGRDSSDDYDTDLENNEKAEKSDQRSDDAAPSVRLYESMCAKYSTPPQTSIGNGLENRELSIRHRSLGTKDMASLAVALTKSSAEVVDLRGNDLRGEGAVLIRTALAVNPTITYLDLSENNLGSVPNGAIVIGEILRYNKTLITLLLSGNHFRDTDAGHLANGMMVNLRLEILDLSHNEFEEIGGINFGRGIAKNSGIDQLDLSWNNIRRKGAVAICKGLQENSTLREINLSCNGFGYEGALAVGELLAKSTPLRQLHLNSNRINWNGALFISKGLAKNKTLEVLKLDSNQLTTTGCMDLIESLSGPQSALRILTVNNVCVIGDFEQIAKEIQRTRDFYFEHGGIVSSHDVLGQRLEKRVLPMQKVINHMKAKEYRPVETFRLLDIDVNRTLTHEEIVNRMKKTGVANLAPHEMEELLQIIEAAQKDGSTIHGINYKNLSQGVKDHIEKQRIEKHRQLEAKERLRRYHKRILSHDLYSSPPSESDRQPLPPIDARSMSVNYGSACSDSLFGKDIRQMAPLTVMPTEPSEEEEEAMRKAVEMDMAALLTGVALDGANRKQTPVRGGGGGGGGGKGGTGKIMSMSTKLGGKAKPFGKNVSKKKKKKKTKTVPKRKHVYENEEYPEFKPE